MPVPPPSSEPSTGGLVDRDRLRRAVRLIHETAHKGITRAALAKGLGDISARSVDRILKLLDQQGAKIIRRKEGQGVLHYVLEQGPSWDEHVSTQARLALRLATMMLTQATASSLEDRLAAVEAHLDHHMSSGDRRIFETLQNAVQVHGGIDDPLAMGDVLEPILSALEKRCVLRLRYRAAGRPQAEEREVIPHKLTLDIFSGGSFLAAWDLRAGAPRHLRLFRIEDATPTHRPGVIPDPEKMDRAARYQIGGWTSGDAPFEVVVLVRGTHWLEAFREAPPALPAFEAEEDGDAIRVTFKANDLRGAARWILQFGAHAEVLAPEGLRDHIRQQLEAALAGYAPEGAARP